MEYVIDDAFQELGDVDGQGVTIEDQPIPDFASLLHEVNTVYRQMMIQVDGLRGEYSSYSSHMLKFEMILAVKTTIVNVIISSSSKICALSSFLAKI